MHAPLAECDAEQGVARCRMGTVEEVAAATAFLASHEASYMTGTCLVIDGGLTAL